MERTEDIGAISTHLYYHVFHLLDELPEVTGEQAGRIAAITQLAFDTAVQQTNGPPTREEILRFDAAINALIIGD